MQWYLLSEANEKTNGRENKMSVETMAAIAATYNPSNPLYGGNKEVLDPSARVAYTMLMLASVMGGLSQVPTETVAKALTGQTANGSAAYEAHTKEELAAAWADWEEWRWEYPADAGEMVAALTAAGYGK